jgi:xylan 1,4-beta-xylosidase
VAAPELPEHPFPVAPVREGFESAGLRADFQWLRSPWPETLFSLTERPGYLRLYGRESVGSLFEQALVARRQQAHCFSAATSVEFEPEHFQQMAGLIYYYNSAKFHYLYISADESVGKHLRVMSRLAEQPDSFTPPVPIPRGGALELRMEVDCERLLVGYRLNGEAWQWLPEQLDASIVSDEAGPPELPNFTGAFVGMCCQDMAGTRKAADFDYFEYQERDFLPNPAAD